MLERLKQHGYRAEGHPDSGITLVVQPDGAHALAAADPVFVVHARRVIWA
ncbi:hypothetical protein [Nonomuraea dietziae]